MKLIVGLGNPGNEYALTRHNIGFMVIDYLLSHNDLGPEKSRFNSLYVKTKIGSEDVIFLKPQNYMNNSGLAVKKFVDYFKIEKENILVISDDLDLKTGQLRLREHCASGGHKGIESINAYLESEEYKRLRIGIAKDNLIPVSDYVLGKLNKEEQVLIKEAIVQASNAILDWLKEPFDKVMNKYNKKDKVEPSNESPA